MVSELDQLLLGDPSGRMGYGLGLFVLASAVLVWVEWRVRRRGETYLDHRETLALGAAFAPVGVAVMISAPWGLLGAAVFVVVAMVACGIGAVVMLMRGAV